MKILVISLAGIGDTFFATPLIHELRLSFPEARIDALVLWKGAADLLQGNPYLNQTYQKNLISSSLADSWRFLRNLAKNGYDVSINTHPQSRIHYRAVARTVAAKKRISHQYGNTPLLDKVLIHESLPQDYTSHSIQNNLALLRFLGVQPKLKEHRYEIFLSNSETDWARQTLETSSLQHFQLLGMHVGSGGTKNLALRRWPLKNYQQLIDRLGSSQPHVRILLFGGPDEASANAELVRDAKFKNVVCPETKNLRQAAALLSSCQAFLSVDTALMHLAAAMHVPHQFVIETPTWNRPIQPYRNSFELIRNPRLKHDNLRYYRYDGKGIRGTNQEIQEIMESVSPEAVYQSITPALVPAAVTTGKFSSV